ncbi:MAG: class I SAM-dependent methyltransferase [candidate division Zixibacteria bacterium]|nr:class I SAM-dependent methyltransferase [candidate division Zixibacteria bacterium]
MQDEWYKHAFRLDYLRVYPHRNDEEARRQIDFLEHTAGCRPPLNVLDLGCGDGRHSLEMARRGYTVTGLDLSEELLTRARERADDAGLTLVFRQGDMREIPYMQAFDLVVNFFTSFGYFATDTENARVLHAIARSLRPGGRFLMDYLNRSSVLRTLVAHDIKSLDGLRIEQCRWVSGDPDRPGDPVRINKRVTIEDAQGRRDCEESVRMFTLTELETLLNAAGLVISRTFGDFDGRPAADDAPRLILIGTANDGR